MVGFAKTYLANIYSSDWVEILILVINQKVVLDLLLKKFF